MYGLRIGRLARSTVLGLAVLATLGAVVACADQAARSASSGRSANSDLNTASRKTFENSATLVDITDAPVSLPSEKVVYPPSTGNAGTLASEGTARDALLLTIVTVSMIALARSLTAGRRDIRS